MNAINELAVDLEPILDELVRRIVEAVHPTRIILFGSAARGEMGPHSDLDVLVVMPDGAHRRHTSQALYMYLSRFDVVTDVVVVTESDILKRGDDPSRVLYPALREGKELYRLAS